MIFMVNWKPPGVTLGMRGLQQLLMMSVQRLVRPMSCLWMQEMKCREACFRTLGMELPQERVYQPLQPINAMGYNVATFGNHEFDWGQVNLANRTTEATYPYVTANIVKNDTGNCATAGWTKPDFADAPLSDS